MILIILETVLITICIVDAFPSIKICKGIKRIINIFYDKFTPQKCSKYIINYYNVSKKFCKKSLLEIMNDIEKVFLQNIKQDGTSSNLKCDYEYLKKTVKLIKKHEEKIKKKKKTNYQLISIIVAIVIGVVQIGVSLL